MRHVRHIFATRNDLEPGIARIEGERELQYIDCASDGSDPLRYYSLLSLPDLGMNKAGRHMDPSYLVMQRSVHLNVRGVPQRKGGIRYVVDQAENPESIVFQPGGLFGAEALVTGHLGTIHENQTARALFEDFCRALTKGFKKVRSYWVGPEALALLDSGFRLVTISHDEPREYDLAR